MGFRDFFGTPEVQPASPLPSGGGWNTILDFFGTPEMQKILSLLCVGLVGVILRARFPAKEPAVVQKMLLQVFLPCTLFRSLAKESIDWSHLGYLGGGIFYIFFKIGCAAIVSYAVFGRAAVGQMGTFRRTALFQLGTTAAGQSVLPFLGELIGQQYVGLGGMVDLPMKLYMIAIMPSVLKAVGGTSASSATQSPAKAVLSAFQDPVTAALILGIVAAFVTNGGGVKVMGPAGTAIHGLAEAQTPVLFFLIGLKLQFKSATPILCLVLLCATYGVTLLLLSLFLRIVNPADDLKMFMVFFVQGAPSVFGMGVINAAINAGLQGFSSDFAFDIVGVTFPISALLQCLAGVARDYWTDYLEIIAVAFLVVAAMLRIYFNGLFQEASGASEQLQMEAGGTGEVQLKSQS